MQARPILPEGYQEAGTIDIKKDRRLLILFNLGALVLLAVSAWLFLRAAAWLRPGEEEIRLLALVQIRSMGGFLLFATWIIGLTGLYVVVHEAIHGVFFWLFTRSRPVFALRWNYAYAAAPGWFIYRDPFLVTTLAPLVIISALGLLVIAAAPPGWLGAVLFVVIMNAAGAVGDLLVSVWLLFQPRSALVQDSGDAITLFLPAKARQVKPEL